MTWQPVPGHLMTRWAKDVTPDTAWPEYPRPQMARPEWLNLNGLWAYAILPKEAEAPTRYDGEILVPVQIESALSGVKRPLQPDQRLWYRRTFDVPDDWRGRRVLLHFGAVDWEATVWVNGQPVGEHRGGYLPFSFEITPALAEGRNELVVAVWDPTDAFWQQRGKQVLKPRSIWYTAVSGIWQTVWLEPAPEAYIAALQVTPDIDAGEVRVQVRLAGAATGAAVRVAVASGLEALAGLSATTSKPPEGSNPGSDVEIRVRIPDPKLWSPDAPHLYDLTVDYGADRVTSYFGMRKFGLGRDDQGRPRLCLNNRPLFQYGPLDQGYWPDGLYTPPSDEAMRWDLELIKRLGCNMLRKHVKVEPARYYYHCDRLGLIVWQDMISGGKEVGPITSWLALRFGSRRRDDRWFWRAGRGDPAGRADYRRELRELVDHLRSFACIGMWVPFNEGWGQFEANAAAAWLKAYDPTRSVDHASGWFDQGGGDCRSIHVYFKALPRVVPTAERAVILSEFGGYTMKVSGHAWNPDVEFGYRKYGDTAALTDAYVTLLEEELHPWIARGLSAAVYTQTTDVEIEVNGLVTYDREVPKLDWSRVAAAHQRLCR